VAGDKKGAREDHAHLIFLDESGFLLVPTLRRTWAPSGRTPILKHVLRNWSRVSAISALSLSPLRERWGFYIRFYEDRIIRAPEVILFLRVLLRHLKGRLVVLWDRGTSHKAIAVRRFLHRHRRRIRVQWLPAYAPEMNPAELGWAYFKHQRIPNHGYPNLQVLHRRLRYEAWRLKRRPELLEAFAAGCELHLHRKQRVLPCVDH